MWISVKGQQILVKMQILVKNTDFGKKNVDFDKSAYFGKITWILTKAVDVVKVGSVRFRLLINERPIIR